MGVPERFPEISLYFPDINHLYFFPFLLGDRAPFLLESDPLMTMLAGITLGSGLVTVSQTTFFGVTQGVLAGEAVRVADFSGPDSVSRFLDATTFLKDPTRGPQVMGINSQGTWATGSFLDEGDFQEDILAASRGLTALVAQDGPRWLGAAPWLVRPLLSEGRTRPRAVVGFSAIRDDGILLSRVAHTFGPFGETLRVERFFVLDQQMADVAVQQEVRRREGEVEGTLEVRLGRHNPLRERVSGTMGPPLSFGRPILDAYRSAGLFASQP